MNEFTSTHTTHTEGASHDTHSSPLLLAEGIVVAKTAKGDTFLTLLEDGQSCYCSPNLSDRMDVEEGQHRVLLVQPTRHHSAGYRPWFAKFVYPEGTDASNIRLPRVPPLEKQMSAEEARLVKAGITPIQWRSEDAEVSAKVEERAEPAAKVEGYRDGPDRAETEVDLRDHKEVRQVMDQLLETEDRVWTNYSLAETVKGAPLLEKVKDDPIYWVAVRALKTAHREGKMRCYTMNLSSDQGRGGRKYYSRLPLALTKEGLVTKKAVQCLGLEVEESGTDHETEVGESADGAWRVTPSGDVRVGRQSE